MTTLHHPCAACGTTTHDGQWWSLGNYYGISGTFCADCYEKVSHDPYGSPRHPQEYAALRERLGDKT